MALNHDITTSLLDVVTSILTPVTVDNCVAGCASRGYSIAGVMNGNQCLCDNAMSSVAPVLDAEQCDRSCAGNSTQVCGGTWHYDIYSTSP